VPSAPTLRVTMALMPAESAVRTAAARPAHDTGGRTTAARARVRAARAGRRPLGAASATAPGRAGREAIAREAAPISTTGPIARMTTESMPRIVATSEPCRASASRVRSAATDRPGGQQVTSPAR
jgi:hypothetical protein